MLVPLIVWTGDLAHHHRDSIRQLGATAIPQEQAERAIVTREVHKTMFGQIGPQKHTIPQFASIEIATMIPYALRFFVFTGKIHRVTVSYNFRPEVAITRALFTTSFARVPQTCLVTVFRRGECCVGGSHFL